MRRYFIFVWMLGFSVLVIGRCFANTPLQDTAVAALKAAHDSATGTIVEHGGMLIRNAQGELHFVEPHVGEETGTQVVDFKILKPGDLFMGTFHTHLCLAHYYHWVFSKQDIISAFLTGVPEFMLDECTGEVHEFDSRADHIADTAITAHIFGKNCEDLEVRLPAGRIVGNIGETEAMHAVVNLDDCKKTPPTPKT